MDEIEDEIEKAEIEVTIKVVACEVEIKSESETCSESERKDGRKTYREKKSETKKIVSFHAWIYAVAGEIGSYVVL